MAINVEIKARLADFSAAKKEVEKISDSPEIKLFQEDIFFNINKGRLKLRVLHAGHGELIYYERADQSGPKTSFYLITKTETPETLKEVLSAALGIRGIVKKERMLFLVKNTRIHLDQVEGLGTFLELEVVMKPDQLTQEGETTAKELMRVLGVRPDDLIEGAYIDLLELQTNSD